MNERVQIFRYVTEGTFDAYMWQLLENKQKFISQIMTSKSPVRSCEDVDDTALSYAEIKALATGNPYIKEKMDLDVQVSKLRMLRAAHTSQQYKLEEDIARTYPTQIAAVQERMRNLQIDMKAAEPLLAQDKDHFRMMVSGRTYTERRDAGTALMKACTASKDLMKEIAVGEFGPFHMTASFNMFTTQYEITLNGHGKYTFEIGQDPSGNVTRALNLIEGLPKRLEDSERKHENLVQQLETAKEEVSRPFPQEAELKEKEARLSELNSMLNMDERQSEAALIDEEADEDVSDGKPEKETRSSEKPHEKKRTHGAAI